LRLAGAEAYGFPEIAEEPMLRSLGSTSVTLAALGFVLAFAVGRPAAAQITNGSPSAAPLITQAIVSTQLTTLLGNTRPEANAQNDQGPVPSGLALPHMLLQLKRSAAQEQAVEALIDQLHDAKSPNFHKWLTPAQFGAQFGLATSDLQKITGWLTGQGFQVNQVYPNAMLIDFSGTAGQVATAFHTSIHNLVVDGKAHFANMSDPQIPAALAPAVAGVVSLHDFRPRPQMKPRVEYTFTSGCQGNFSPPCYAVTPADLATIYNLNPLFNAGVSGQGQTIYVVEDTDLYTNADWATFRSEFGLAGYTGASLTTVQPAPSGGSACGDPGINGNGDDGEAILDAEYASAAAPNAAIVVASCINTATFGGLTAIENLVNGANPPAIISLSYGECEVYNGAAANAAFNTAYQTGVAGGMSIFVSAGDEDASECDAGAATTTHGIGVNADASTPYNVAVGGTDFSDTYSGTNSTYWSTSNSATFGSALSYIPEIPWNYSCASELLANYEGFNNTHGASSYCNSGLDPSFFENTGGSGGPSGCATGAASTNGVVSGTCAGYAKPSWQTGVIGIPNDGVRDLPDVSLFAANGLWNHYYVYCWSNPTQSVNGSAPCTGAPSSWAAAGGTSFASPIMAGIQALVNQYTGEKQGNPNVSYYKIAAAEYGQSGSATCNSSLGNAVAGSCVFYDVTLGDNDTACTGTVNCFNDGGTYGVLSTSNSAFQPAYKTGVGWDFATGLGSVNAHNLVIGWNYDGTTSFVLSASTVGNGTVTSTPSGISCGLTCSASFTAGQQVSLTAAPAAGWSFAGWSGACSGASGCSVAMGSNQSVIATFTQNSFTLTAGETGSGTITSGDGKISCGQTCSASYLSGTQVSLTATPDAGWSFAGWGGACSGTGGCTVTMNAATSVSATFTQSSFALSTSISPSGGGAVGSSPPGINCGSTCSASFLSNTVVSLTETPASGFAFAGWGGACSGVGTCVVTMSAAQSVSASFTQTSNPPTSPLLAAILPSSRSALVNNTVTAFATILNTGASAASACAIAPVGDPPLNFVYQTTDPRTNALTGTANTPVDIPGNNGAQTFVIALTPTAVFIPNEFPFSFACNNVLPAPSQTGLNTLLLSSSASPVPDIVALGATTLNDGILHLPPGGAAAFAVATVNVGAAGAITATANTESVTLPLNLALCQTDPGSGQCINPGSPVPSVTTAINAFATPTFAIFGLATGPIPFDPANNRIFVNFTDDGGNIRGQTSVAASVAVTTQVAGQAR
jgi:hypothetical protein